MKKDKLITRFILFIIGLFIISLGVALSVKANLGVSPISCIPYVYSLSSSFSLGQLTVVFNILLILLQIVLLRRNYRPVQLIQLPVIVVFGFFIDFTVYIVSGLSVSGYLWQLFLCLASCATIGFGVFLEVKAQFSYLPGEGVAVAISETFNLDFGKAKIGTDSTMVIIGVITSFVLKGHLVGVREGTVISALLIGYIAKFYAKRIRQFDKLLV